MLFKRQVLGTLSSLPTWSAVFTVIPEARKADRDQVLRNEEAKLARIRAAKAPDHAIRWLERKIKFLKAEANPAPKIIYTVRVSKPEHVYIDKGVHDMAILMIDWSTPIGTPSVPVSSETPMLLVEPVSTPVGVKHGNPTPPTTGKAEIAPRIVFDPGGDPKPA